MSFLSLELDDPALQKLDLGVVSRLLALPGEGHADIPTGFPNPPADHIGAQLPGYLGTGDPQIPYLLDRLELVLAAKPLALS